MSRGNRDFFSFLSKDGEKKFKHDLVKAMQDIGIRSIQIKPGKTHKITRVSFLEDTSKAWSRLLNSKQQNFFEQNLQINKEEISERVILEEQEIDTDFPKHIYSSVARKFYKKWVEINREQQKERITLLKQNADEKEKEFLSEVEIRSLFEPEYEGAKMDGLYWQRMNLEAKKIIYSQIVVNNQVKNLEKKLNQKHNKKHVKRWKKGKKEISVNVE